MSQPPPPAYTGPERILSGVQPSGALHLGNYLGALVKFARLQHERETFIFVADQHAITVWQEPSLLAQQTREITAAYLAAGLDPAKLPWLVVPLAVAAAVTRIMAVPAVETWLRRFLPFLAAAPAPKD